MMDLKTIDLLESIDKRLERILNAVNGTVVKSIVNRKEPTSSEKTLSTKSVNPIGSVGKVTVASPKVIVPEIKPEEKKPIARKEEKKSSGDGKKPEVQKAVKKDAKKSSLKQSDPINRPTQAHQKAGDKTAPVLIREKSVVEGKSYQKRKNSRQITGYRQRKTNRDQGQGRKQKLG